MASTILLEKVPGLWGLEVHMQIAATHCEEAVASLLGTTQTPFWVGSGVGVREKGLLRRPGHLEGEL